MFIDIIEPIYPIDRYAQHAFVQILNIVILSEHVMELNNRLVKQDNSYMYGSLSGYFRWSFGNEHFTLWQRTEYGSDICFEHATLRLHFEAFTYRKKIRTDSSNN